MNLIIKGFIIGLGKIIPGVSGAMLAITLGIYGKTIETISNIKQNKIENLKFLSKIGCGIMLSIILMSKIIVKCINEYYFPTILLFIGLIIGGMPKLIRQTKYKKKDFIISVIILIIIFIFIKNVNMINNYQVKLTLMDSLKLIGVGIIDAISSIVPGISGTALLMMIGYYNIIISTFSSILKINKIYQNLFILLPFGFGFIIGTFLISIIINYLLKKYNNLISQIITIFMTVTIIILVKDTFSKPCTINQIIIGIVLLITGIIISLKMNQIKT